MWQCLELQTKLENMPELDMTELGPMPHLCTDPVTVHASCQQYIWYDGQTINMTTL